MRVVTIGEVNKITSGNMLIGYEARYVTKGGRHTAKAFNYDCHEISHDDMIGILNSMCGTEVPNDCCLNHGSFINAGIKFTPLDVVPLEILGAVINDSGSKKILEFRAGFVNYDFASEDELKIFEASIMNMKPTTDAEEFNNWWRNYAALKGWNEHEVLKFIQDYNKSRE